MRAVIHEPAATPTQRTSRQKRVAFEQAILRRAAAISSQIEYATAVITAPTADAVAIPIEHVETPAESIDVVPTECRAVFVSADSAVDLGATVDPAPSLSIEKVQRVVAAELGVRRLDLVSNRRTADIVWPRHVAMYLCREMTPRSLPEIGRRFGNRDHTSVMHAHRKIGALVGSDPAVASQVAFLKARVCAGATS